MYSCVVKMR